MPEIFYGRYHRDICRDIFAGADFVTAYRAFHSKLSLLYDSSVLFFIIGENPVKNKEVFLSNRQKSDIILTK